MKTNIILNEPDYYAREALIALILRDPRFKLIDVLTCSSGLNRCLDKKPICQLVYILSDTRNIHLLPRNACLNNILLTNRLSMESLSPQNIRLLKGIFFRNEIGYGLCNAVLFTLKQTQIVASVSVAKILKKLNIPHIPYFLFENHKLPQYLQEVAYLKYQQGFTNQQIEEILCLSKHTLYDYLKQIKQCLGVSGTNSQSQCYQKLTGYSFALKNNKNPPIF